MTSEQETKIKSAIRMTDWKYPIIQNIAVRHVLLDLSDLLPDDNIERFLRDCPQPPIWHYYFDEKEFIDNGDKGAWSFFAAYERKNWYSQAVVSPDASGVLHDEDKEIETEQAILYLYTLLIEATDYTGDKTDEERQTMREEFNKIKQDGPPKEIPDWVEERIQEINHEARQDEAPGKD